MSTLYSAENAHAFTCSDHALTNETTKMVIKNVLVIEEFCAADKETNKQKKKQNKTKESRVLFIFSVNVIFC